MQPPTDRDLRDLGQLVRAAVASRVPTAVVQAIYVFGSLARGALRADSDADIALLLARPLEERVVYELALDLACSLGRDVDLIDLRRASTVLATQVVGSGRRIEAGDPHAAMRFEGETFAEYAYLNERRGPAIKAFKDRILGESA